MTTESGKDLAEMGHEIVGEVQNKSPSFVSDEYDMANNNVVKSEGQATMFVEPDVIEFILRADSMKESAEEVKSSISKRVDYLMQVVKSKIQGEKNIILHELLDKRDDIYTMSAEILVRCGSLQKYEEIRSIVVEKLGGTVIVTDPRHYHTHRCLQEARPLPKAVPELEPPDFQPRIQKSFIRGCREFTRVFVDKGINWWKLRVPATVFDFVNRCCRVKVLRLAMSSARTKAMELASLFQKPLGPAVFVLEMENSEKPPPQLDDNFMTAISMRTHPSSRVLTSRIKVVFELMKIKSEKPSQPQS